MRIYLDPPGADGKADFRILPIVPARLGSGRQVTAAQDAIYGDAARRTQH
jgi:hypothetical protein